MDIGGIKMGTNFYWIKGNTYGKNERDSLENHIGKRSAAGNYCWDCGTTLCKSGTADIHTCKRGAHHSDNWYEYCPSCGKTVEKETYNSAYVELGFAQPTTHRLKGVSSCSSFTWTLMKHYTDLQKLARLNSKPIIRDEYGRTMSASDFLDMVESCPIWYQTPQEFC